MLLATMAAHDALPLAVQGSNAVLVEMRLSKVSNERYQ